MDDREQLQVIRRGVEQIVPDQELEQKLRRSLQTNRPLRVKYGIDPTGIDVHLGHTVPLRKLRQFQELGHTAVIIIGNYTAIVGDPSGRDQTRAGLSEQEVEANAKDYLDQIQKVVDLSRAEVHRNGDWFSRMQFREVLDLCSHITVAQLLERDDFQKRIQAQSPIYLSECLYPLMQGWDSVEVRADVELGGSEQLFSLLVARELQRDQGQEPQVAITMPILVGTDGSRRMGKSLGNYIGINERADEMFGKLMSIPDECMRSYYELLSDLEPGQIDQLLGRETHPRDAKVKLGKQIVAQYHGAQEADRAAVEFDRRFRQQQDPSDIPEIPILPGELNEGKIWIARLLVLAGLAPSNAQARRLVSQGAVTIGLDRQKITDPTVDVAVVDNMIVRAGKRRIVRTRLASR